MLKIIKNFLTYSTGAVVLRLITSTIAFTAIHFLTPTEYGLLALINTFIGIAPIFLSLGLRQAYSLDFFHTDNVGRKKILNDIIIIYLIISVPIFIIASLNLSIINKYIFLNQASPITLLLIFTICFIHFFTELLFQTLRYQSKAMHFTATQIIMGTITALTTFILVYFTKLKITGIVFGNLFGMLIIALYALYLYTKKVGSLNLNTNKKQASYYLKLGLPFIPSIIFSWILSFGDRWMLARYATLHEVGIYSLADSFGILFQMLILYPLSNSYIPHIFKMFSENKTKILEIDQWNKDNMYKCMTGMFIVVTIGFLVCQNIFYLIIPIKYHESIKYIWLILIGQIFFMGSYFATCYLQYFKKTYYLVGFTIFSSLLNTLLNIILIPRFSIYGCIIATTISYMAYLAIIIFVTNNVQQNTHVLEKLRTNIKSL